MRYVKNIPLFLVFIVTTLFLSGCIPFPGIEAGDVYIAYYFDAETDPVAIEWDTNEYLPDTFVVNNYYLAGPGTYSGRYRVHYGVFNYTYRLWTDFSLAFVGNPDDTYFMLWLSPEGPVFYDMNYGAEPLRSADRLSSRTALPMDTSGVVEVSKNGYHIRLEYWRSE